MVPHKKTKKQTFKNTANIAPVFALQSFLCFAHSPSSAELQIIPPPPSLPPSDPFVAAAAGSPLVTAASMVLGHPPPPPLPPHAHAHLHPQQHPHPRVVSPATIGGGSGARSPRTTSSPLMGKCATDKMKIKHTHTHIHTHTHTHTHTCVLRARKVAREAQLRDGDMRFTGDM